jgi:aspartate/methionine/tyrosine aminotransferase
MLSKRALKIEASEIRKAFELGRSLKNPIDLSIGQPDFEVPPGVKQAAMTAIQDGLNRYTPTQGIAELREKLIQKFNKRFGFQPPALMVTAGAAGAIVLCLMVIIDDGDEVIIPDPYFPLYKHIVHITGGIAKFANTYPDFKFKRETFEKLITNRTKAIIFSSPNNPTGVVYTKDEILMLVDIAKKHNLLIISDEVYSSFVYDCEVESAIKYYDKTLFVDAFSKAYGMPGWRLGYTVGPVELIEKMAVLQQWSFICAPAPFQKAGVEALNTDMSGIIKQFHKRRDMVYETLKTKFKVTKPYGAFYIFPQLPDNNVTDFIRKAAEHNVLLVPGCAFSEQNTNFRISYAVDESKLRQGLEIILKLA